MKKTLLASSLALVASFAYAEQEAQLPQTLFQNVDVFNGTENKLYEDHFVLVEGNIITSISAKAIDVRDDAVVIDGTGKTLTPGFIENHAHLMLMGPSLPTMESNTTWEDFAIHGTRMAEMYLMQGFTTVRDAGGANGGLRRAIDAGQIIGPRYYPSGAFLSTRGGHADFANYTAPVGEETNFSRLNMAQEVDSVAEVKKYARNNFRMGATQLKYMQSGGVVSAFDPWQLLAGSPEEVGAAVEVADTYGSYVMAHSYRKEAIIGALNAGVKSIEHGFMFDCEISELMEEKGAYITTNLTAFDPNLLEIPAVKNVASSLAKAKSASAAFKDYIPNMKKCPAPRGFQTDCVGSVDACNIQIAYEKKLNNDFFGPYESLKTLTSVGGEIATLSGDFMNPYPDAKLGVIEKGAYADILLLDGNPFEDFSVVGTGDQWFGADKRPDSPESIKLIMKDGVVYKNTL
ncbi:Amidohydrolase [Vibrio chagasii]|uniref:metal-dependent hydrolase family protein n=1 Tax=Vibrio TaxID=662 RepID=UPI000E32544B|nr:MULTISPECIES: amidohydrolase family protein [Vibrio]MDE9380762.1 amidohydrolase family protein [Vibrio alginolyticus]MCG9562256.1 amidohydrolase family protein [Vibrio chagasii]MCG9567118.1 amidohydrolase family protein [Vibrio chagasii]MCG9607291.1 amidohydrolase family protein [Vibrio chagasii]MCG9672853.1 amidohydrolase family protein [Vibrio chagasii]